jgi:hypothetical protein
MIEAIITDVTRMGPPRVCIAARHGKRTIRLDEPQPDERFLVSVGGLQPGEVVSLEWGEDPFCEAPHVEDGDWEPRSVRKLGRLGTRQLLEVLSPDAATAINDAFGPAWFLSSRGNGAFRPGEGERSLASLIAHEVRVYQWFEGVRADFSDGYKRWTNVPVEDLVVRQHQLDCPDCLSRFNRNLAREFGSRDALLRVGLTRPYTSGQYEKACWLQVTGIYPLGRDRRHFV